MTRSPNWRKLDAATSPRGTAPTPPAPRRPEASTETPRPAETPVGDGPVDGWTDSDEFLSTDL